MDDRVFVGVDLAARDAEWVAIAEHEAEVGGALVVELIAGCQQGERGDEQQSEGR